MPATCGVHRLDCTCRSCLHGVAVVAEGSKRSLWIFRVEISHDHVLPKCSSLNENCMLSYIKPLEVGVFHVWIGGRLPFFVFVLCYWVGPFGGTKHILEGNLRKVKNMQTACIHDHECSNVFNMQYAWFNNYLTVNLTLIVSGVFSHV